MPTFKDRELEQLSQQILSRAAQRQQPQGTPAISRIRQISLQRKLPRLLRKRF